MDIQTIKDKKARGEKITMLTAYDHPLAGLLDQAGIDMVLIGDSLSNVALGLESTRDVGMEEMLHHSKAVRRGVKNALVIGDMPFVAYQTDILSATLNARRFVAEAGCHAVKVEWFDRCVEVIKDLREADIEVMGHIGLTPQRAEELGGFKVQGVSAEGAARILLQAKQLEQAGCFAIVMECIPESLAQEITASVSVPTIGIGAGKYCDGQVLVTQDMLGTSGEKVPKFVKRYANIGQETLHAIKMYKAEVEQGTFPGQEQSYH